MTGNCDGASGSSIRSCGRSRPSDASSSGSSARSTSGASPCGRTPRRTRACASGGCRSRQVRPALTVGTLGEAEVFAPAGLPDIFVAYPVGRRGPKAERVARSTGRRTCGSASTPREGPSSSGSRREGDEPATARARRDRPWAPPDGGRRRRRRPAVARARRPDCTSRASSHGAQLHAGRRRAARSTRSARSRPRPMRSRRTVPEIETISAGSTPTRTCRGRAAPTRSAPGRTSSAIASRGASGAMEADETAAVVAPRSCRGGIAPWSTRGQGTDQGPAGLAGTASARSRPIRIVIEKVSDYHGVTRVPPSLGAGRSARLLPSSRTTSARWWTSSRASRRRADGRTWSAGRSTRGAGAGRPWRGASGSSRWPKGTAGTGCAGSTRRGSRPATPRSRATCPDWSHWDHSHRPECRLVARDPSHDAVVGWAALTALVPPRLSRRRLGERVRRRDVAWRGVGRRCPEAQAVHRRRAGYWKPAGRQSSPRTRQPRAPRARRLPARRRAGADRSRRPGRWRDRVLLDGGHHGGVPTVHPLVLNAPASGRPS